MTPKSKEKSTLKPLTDRFTVARSSEPTVNKITTSKIKTWRLMEIPIVRIFTISTDGKPTAARSTTYQQAQEEFWYSV